MSPVWRIRSFPCRGGCSKNGILMSDQLEGHCLCGSVSYLCDAEPQITFVCHCEDCQRQTGPTFSIVVGVPRAALHLDGDTLSAAPSAHPAS